ncbi:MAG: hypothetical protein Q8927_17820 [Bacteroidota bacterium]|nr:hypothetical protein [Bacteroidota bacterium]MDP4218065.1 hypothetical protein [Bacteroidota bacterium]MDP4247886.1 hypothetical protein [Bacteroidota bacterium]MDP4253609.1 hypothetical protein [Bacteroidota bacterium]MDP4258289.1 hypothetical protein [Bacteroidota bacterium]
MDKTENKADWTEVAHALSGSYGLDLAERMSIEEGEALLAERLNEMARDDFHGLVALLYRIDVDETRLRETLHARAGEDAGKIMARMVIERIWQKVLTRRQYGQGGKAGSGDWASGGDGAE